MLTAAMAQNQTHEALPDWVVDVLVRIDENLDRDLGLKALSQDWGASAYKFHRLFAETVGDTPKRRINRIRLERAAQVLATTDCRVLDIALAVGFGSHETFTRAFKRTFGVSPIEYRKRRREIQSARARRNQSFRGWCCRLSDIRIERRANTNLIAIRQFGAYAGFPPVQREKIWAELHFWAAARGLTPGSERLGLFPDDPMLTPGPQQGADLCLAVDRPVQPDGRVRHLCLAGRAFAVIEHFGPYETLIQAYRMLEDALNEEGDHARGDGPPLQSFRTVAEGGDPSANLTEVWMPVVKRR